MPMSPAEIAILDANSAFYAAFAGRHYAALERLWARVAPVSCVHPGWAALRGRRAVMDSWRAILAGDAPAIRCTAAAAQVLGSSAVVICQELVPGQPPMAATNVFVLEAGAWRLCHHQAGPIFQTQSGEEPGAQA